MELKNALSVCLISLFSATLVVLIARSLDSQAASRLEPHLAKIVEELEAIRTGGGMATSPAVARGNPSLRDGLMVYYFHGNTRCPTCEAIESRTHATLQADFSSHLANGELVWKTVNYEKSGAADLVTKFEIQMPVVVLARMHDGEIGEWNRLDQVWGLVGDKTAFSRYIHKEVQKMLSHSGSQTSSPRSTEVPNVSLPEPEVNELPIPTDPSDLPLPR